MDTRRRKQNIVLFSVYCILMLRLMLHRAGASEGIPYWQEVKMSLNLIPFRTIGNYAHLLLSTRSNMVHLAVVNLFGNVIMFIPLGFFLPRVFPRLRKFRKTLLAALLAISIIELLQLFLLVGSCDVDDLILNLPGVALGYGLFRFMEK